MNGAAVTLSASVAQAIGLRSIRRNVAPGRAASWARVLTCGSGTRLTMSMSPDFMFVTRALSSVNTLNSTPSRYGLPCCQYVGLRRRRMLSPVTRWAYRNGPVPTGLRP